MDSAGKRGKSQTDARAATAGPCCSCQQDSLAACKHVATRRSWRTWNEQGAKQSKLNGGKNVEGSGHGMAKASRHTKPAEQGRCRRTQPADSPPGTGLKETQQPADQVGRPHAVQCRLMGGVQWCWYSGRRARTYLPCLYPTYRLCLSLYLPTPLICKTQFSPNLIFFVIFIFIFLFYPFTLPHKNSSPNPLLRHCSANL